LDVESPIDRQGEFGVLPEQNSDKNTGANEKRRQAFALQSGDFVEAGAFPGFAFSYHGRNQRLLKEQFAAFYEPYFRDQPPPTGSGLRDRKRIGILVTQRHEGLFIRCMSGIIERLDRERFEVAILCSRSIAQRLKREIHGDDLQFIAFDNSAAGAIERIRAAACDLIYYWEVGSDAVNYFLPFARLAPVQCTGWATSITSGVPAVDYFLSSELIETPYAGEANSAEQYTERLWLSKTLFMYAPRLAPVAPAAAAHFGLPDDRSLYVCFQNPLKIHPDTDALFAQILAADPRGLIVLSGRQPAVVRLLKERFTRRIPQAAQRIVFLPPQSFADYCRLLQLADVILDTPHYGAGSSCYDLFSCNIPVVTLPGELIIGRITQACYRKMGVDDLIVRSGEEYVANAVQVATDRDYRSNVTKRIADRSDVLFNDTEAVREHERFFEQATQEIT
jgi:predicted O-linked N-acetylglucosamine transferase (SPINDLY family)